MRVSEIRVNQGLGVPDFFMHCPNGYLRFEGSGEIPWGR